MTDVLSEQKNIAVIFLQQAAKNPQSPAVIDDKQRVTYEQLAGMAGRVAQNIIDKTGTGASQVCILAAHDISAVAAMLGVLMAGKCFVPLLPQENDGYLRYLWENSEASLIACSPEESMRAAAICGDARRVVICELIPDDTNIFDPSSYINNPANISAIMYTSGSTGQPKGVMTTGESIFNRAVQHIEMAGVVPSDKQASVVPWQFAASFPDIFAPLLTGASLYMYDIHLQGIERLGRWIQKNETTLLKLPADLVRRFVQSVSADMLISIRYYYSGGGALKVQDARLLLSMLPDKAILTHGYSSTETNLVAKADWSLSNKIFREPSAEGMLPAGYPLPGKEIKILDDKGIPVPTGEEGDLVVISRYMFAGYWGAPEITSQCLKELPDGECAYYTGDLGRINMDGCLELVGRRGHRVKIRGLRIDLEAVESLLLSLPYVRAVAAVTFSSPGRELQLVAHLETLDSDPVTTTRLREDLKKIAPQYMVPSRFILVDALPRTANGKIDRNALRSPGRKRPVLANPYEPPRAPLENLLADIWAEVLDLEKVGVYDHFLELGGDSLLALELEARIQNELNIKDPLNRLIRASTIAQMAKMIYNPQSVHLPSRDINLPLRWRIKYLHRKIKSGLIHASPALASFSPSYKSLIRFQKFWLSLPCVKYTLRKKMYPFEAWLRLTGQSDESGELILRNLMANTWRFSRNFLMAQRATVEQWVSVAGWEHVIDAAIAKKGVIFVTPHTHIFFLCVRMYLTSKLFPEIYFLGQKKLAPDRIAKTIGLAKRFREARNTLKRGGAVWIAGDGSQGTVKLVMKRFGGTFQFRGGAAELALQTGAPLIPVFPSMNIQGGIYVQFNAPITSRLNAAPAVCSEDILRQYAEIYIENWPQMLPNIIYGHQEKRLGNTRDEKKEEVIG